MAGRSKLSVERPAHNDFNGDGVSDVLLQQRQWHGTNWLGQAPNGNFTSNIDNVNFLTGSRVACCRHRRLQRRRHDDVLWRNDTARSTDWLGQAERRLRRHVANADITCRRDWHVVGTGDFNGDGRDRHPLA